MQQNGPDLYFDEAHISLTQNFDTGMVHLELVAHHAGANGALVARQAGVIHTTPEHMKVLIYVLWRYMVRAQKDAQSIVISPAMLEQLQVDPATWRAFWGEQETNDGKPTDTTGTTTEPVPPDC